MIKKTPGKSQDKILNNVHLGIKGFSFFSQKKKKQP